MDYLKEYHLNEDDINEIKNSIDERDILEYSVHEEHIRKLLDYLTSKKLNIKELLKNKSYLFYTDASVLINKFNSIEEDKLKELNDNIDILDELL